MDSERMARIVSKSISGEIFTIGKELPQITGGSANIISENIQEKPTDR